MSELAGTWYDGRSGRGVPVRLSQPAPRTLRIEPEGGEPFALDVAAVALSTRLAGTARQLHLRDQGQVEVADSPLLDAWFPHQSRIERAVDWLERRRTAALVAAIGTVVAVVGFFSFGLPWAAEVVAPHVPPVVERAMTAQVIAVFEQSKAIRGTHLPAARQRELRARFDALVAGLPRRDQMRLEFYDAPGIGANAFALPDGRLVMTDELVRLAGSDDELVAVMAHEAGHHVHRHALRQALESSGVVAMLSVLVGDVSGSSLTVSIPVVLLQTGFSRDHEREADRFAIDLLRARGMSPHALAELLRRLRKAQGGGDHEPVSWLSTHPADAERIEAAERAAQPPR